MAAWGGGGVGRIHLNSLSGDLVLEGELSPAAGECNSTGLITRFKPRRDATASPQKAAQLADVPSASRTG